MESIWKCRNLKFWECDDASPHVIVTPAKDTLNKSRYMQIREKHLGYDTNLIHSWFKHPLGTIKCNVDCASFNNNSITWYEMCFRESTKQML